MISEEQKMERLNDSIERMRRHYGELITWRYAGYKLHVPSALVASINRETGVRRDLELRVLTGVLLPQLEQITDKRSDYERLVALAVKELWESNEVDATPQVVPITWTDGRDACSENIKQTYRSLDVLRKMATELIDEAANAKIQRSVMNPDHPKGRLGMIYTDERVATAEHIAKVLNAAADKLLGHAHAIGGGKDEQT